MTPSLKTARSIVASFSVNVKLHPEYLTTHENLTQSCDRNFKVWQAIMAIDELIRSL